MKAKGEQMERAIQSAGGAEPAPHVVPPKYATAEQMERLIGAIANGGGSGGATSLNDLSDVKITEPLGQHQMLVYYEGDAFTLGHFKNRRITIGDLDGISRNVSDAGITLISGNAGGAVFDYYQCAESPNYDAASAQAVTQIISLLKVSAKASGKAGTKVPTDAAGMLSILSEIADTRKRIPIAKFGDYTFYPKGRISTSKMLFSCADTDADGLYDITVAIDSVDGAIYVTVEYTACPAMS